MSWREDLALFGITVPENIPIDRWASMLGEEPCRNALAVVGLSTLAFLVAERGRNPRVNDVWDALLYCSTCLSVGYADIHPRTPAGKVIGSALMTLGPAMAARTLDGGKNRESTQGRILDTLEQILGELRAQPSTPTAQSESLNPDPSHP